MTSLGIKLNKLWPGFLDDYLVHRSFGKTDGPRDLEQPDNLWKPAPGNWAAHGPFDAEAVRTSLHFQLSKRRGLMWAVCAGTVLGCLFAAAAGIRAKA